MYTYMFITCIRTKHCVWIHTQAGMVAGYSFCNFGLKETKVAIFRDRKSRLKLWKRV